jgi:hypothetical protein
MLLKSTSCLLLLSLLWASGAAAQRIEVWKTTLHDMDGQLRRKEWTAARSRAIELTKDMLDDRGVRGISGAYPLAMACAFRAIAEAGLGHEDEAHWYWRTAAAVDPGVEKTDLKPYGAPAERLGASSYRAQLVPIAKLQPTGTRPKIERPVVIKRSNPADLEKMRHVRLTAHYAFEVVIDRQGHPIEPVILTPASEPSLVYAILDSLKDWEFKPAMQEGKPIPVLYTLTVDYDLRRQGLR